MKISNKGFTLAEVLITIGIIGIVSALLISVVISKYKQKNIESKLKKSYTILNQMFIRSEADNGSAINWTWNGSSIDIKNDKKFFETYFGPYLNIIDIKNKNVHEQYNSSGYEMYFQNGNRAPDVYGYIFELSNGYAVLPHIFSTNSATLGSFLIILPDTNKKHLVQGRDVFTFAIVRKNESIVIEPNTYLKWTCNTLTKNRQTFLNRCQGKLDSSGVGAAISCTYLIYCNNWEIPDDYPIKF